MYNNMLYKIAIYFECPTGSCGVFPASAGKQWLASRRFFYPTEINHLVPACV